MHNTCVSLGMAYVKKIPTGTHTVVDKQTGEILECVETTRTQLVKDKDAWCIIYAKYLVFERDFSAAEGSVMSWCCMNAALDTNIITLNKYYKEQLARDMSLHKRTLENTISQLSKKGLLTRLGAGVYRVDPEISWRGSLAERTKVLKIHLEFKLQHP